jgi:hypothetical protein
MTVLNIETKENSPEKLAAIAGKETKYFLMAEEFNDVVVAINELIIPRPFGTFKWILRGSNHNGTTPIAGDIFEGMISETEFSDSLIWNGTGPHNNTNLENFNILNSIEIS